MKVELLSVTPDAELLIERAARECYESFGKICEGSHVKIIQHCIGSGHDSILEFGNVCFRVSGISRACANQLVRHRTCSFAQKSQRYVKEAQFDYVTPKEILSNPQLNDVYEEFMRSSQRMYNFLLYSGVKAENARFALPSACETSLVVGVDFRNLRHLLKLRCSTHAQWEIRNVAREMLKIVYEKAPTVFSDLKEKFLNEE